MYSTSLGRAVLQKVVAKLGGVYAAAVHLGIEPSLVRRFLRGTVPVPDVVLLRAVDTVLEDSPGRPADSQTFPRVRP